MPLLDQALRIGFALFSYNGELSKLMGVNKDSIFGGPRLVFP